jgi:hypothetical protein
MHCEAKRYHAYIGLPKSPNMLFGWGEKNDDIHHTKPSKEADPQSDTTF